MTGMVERFVEVIEVCFVLLNLYRNNEVKLRKWRLPKLYVLHLHVSVHSLVQKNDQRLPGNAKPYLVFNLANRYKWTLLFKIEKFPHHWMDGRPSIISITCTYTVLAIIKRYIILRKFYVHTIIAFVLIVTC